MFWHKYMLGTVKNMGFILASGTRFMFPNIGAIVKILDFSHACFVDPESGKQVRRVDITTTPSLHMHRGADA